jgi:acid phosphatase
MRKLTSILVLVSLFLGINYAVFASEPANLGLARQAVAKYYDSGEYSCDVKNIVTRVEQYVENRLQQERLASGMKMKHKFAVTFDIDDTLLSTYPTAKSYNFCEQLPEIIANERKGIYPAIPEMLGLYRFLQSKNIAIFLVTGRREIERSITEKNLHDAGYSNWQYLYMRPSNDHGKRVSAFKSNSREAIEQRGYDIVFNIGDQFSDLAGGEADAGFKLPNPMYFIP